MKILHLISLKLAALTAAVLLLSSSAGRAQSPPPSPVGNDWDCVFSGSQLGLAVLTFNANNTLAGYEIVRPAPHKGASTDVNPRGPGAEDAGRTTTTTTSSGGSTKVITNFLGSAPINGTWYHDAAGKIVGLLNQLSQTVTPMEVYSTNQLGEVVTNINYVVTTETNAVSFRAVVVPNSHITICTYGPNGNNVLRGKPVDLAQLDQSGNFYALGKRDGLNFVEFMTFTPDGVVPNRYNFTAGMGPGYGFSGRALVSRSKQIAIYTLTDAGDVLSVYTGSYNLVSKKGKLGGLDSSNSKLNYNVAPRP